MPKQSKLYYGWVLILMLSLTTMVSWGATYYAFSVVLTPMRQSEGWTSAQLTGAFSISLLVTSIADIAVGRWLDARGPRVLMTVGAIFTALLMFVWSRVESLTGLYLTLALLGISGSMVQYSPAFWLATQWFKRRRALALTVITLGGGLASTVFVPLTNALTHAYGWRGALTWIAAITAFATILPHALLLRRSPADVNAHVDGASEPSETPSAAPVSQLVEPAVLRQPLFWLLALAYGLAALAFNGISVHLLSYEASRGQDTAFAAAAAGFSGVVQVLGRILIMPVGDRLPRKHIITALFAFQFASYVALLLLPARVGLIAHVVLRGIGAGPQAPMRAALLADLYGVRRYGSVAGQLSFLTGIAGSVAPFFVGAVVDQAGYAPVLWAFVVALGVATAVMVVTKLAAAE
jgi:MFS family permease